MLYIKNLEEGLELFKALGSEIRLKIVRLLILNGSMSMHEIAENLNITDGALTSHIKKLEKCGVVYVSTESESDTHGNRKLCSVRPDKIFIDIKEERKSGNIFETSLRVGQFTDYEVYPTCGLATGQNIIGEVDDGRYFSASEHYKADILWFTRGFVEYRIPNLIPANAVIDELTVTAELSSEAPGYNNVWPSDIYFYLNGVFIGIWTSPGDFGDIKGIFTPDWWFPNWNQHGLLKMLVINRKGTFIDGLKISDVSMEELELDSSSNLTLRLEVPENAKNVGGLTIYGKGFGNYNQDIDIRISYNEGDQNDK